MKQIKWIDKVKAMAREIKRNVFVLYLAYKDPRVSWFAKLIAVGVVAYAFSPIDLIPDFIPVLGYLDDLIIVPLGITIALKLIPQEVIRDCRDKAEEIRKKGKPTNWITGGLFILAWIVFAVWIGSICYKLFT
ncbi:YkvA family protein [Paenibacillus illinoisensis]|uniref:YkvA family protein n=1 Tax=Paenibacillus illinoisensis TaxID=59845 RepID=UPI003017A636